MAYTQHGGGNAGEKAGGAELRQLEPEAGGVEVRGGETGVARSFGLGQRAADSVSDLAQ